MPISEAALAEAAAVGARLERARADGDRRAEVCGCGHPMAKHESGVCYQGRLGCVCRVPLAVLKVPNARVFAFRSDDVGHAVAKGISRTMGMGLGHRLDWVARCSECGEEPVTVVSLEGGKVNVPRCGEHR